MSGADSTIEFMAFVVESPMSEKGVAEDEVERIVLDVEFEERAEHRGEHAHHEERIEHRPEHTERTAAIFELEILADQGCENKPVMFAKKLCRACQVRSSIMYCAMRSALQWRERGANSVNTDYIK